VDYDNQCRWGEKWLMVFRDIIFLPPKHQNTKEHQNQFYGCLFFGDIWSFGDFVANILLIHSLTIF
jgi:hypothetical protein